MYLYNNLKETRLKKNLTQEALAGVVGVTRQTIIAIEKEKYVRRHWIHLSEKCSGWKIAKEKNHDWNEILLR
jgi:transcriptional regulator with XRE-family HTH domain